MEALQSIIGPFGLALPTILVSSIYALIRAKHDSTINEGEWKKWASVEVGFWGIVWGLAMGDSLLDYIALPLIFAGWFSLVFDMACGWFRAKKLFYFGSGKWDQKIKRMFIKPRNYFIAKFVTTFVAMGGYYSIKYFV